MAELLQVEEKDGQHSTELRKAELLYEVTWAKGRANADCYQHALYHSQMWTALVLHPDMPADESVLLSRSRHLAKPKGAAR